MPYLPVLAGLGAAIGFGISDYFVVKPTRAIGQYRALAYASLFSTIAQLPVLLYFGLSTGASQFVLLLALLDSIALFVGGVLSLKAYRYGNLSITAPIINTYPALAVVLAVFLLGDALSLPQAFLVAMVIVGVALISIDPKALKSKKILAAGVGSAVIASVLYSFTSLFSGIYTIVIGFALFAFMTRAVGTVGSFAAVRARHEDLGPGGRRLLVPLALAGVMDAFGALSWVYGVFVLPSSLPIVASVAGFAGGIAAIAGFVVLRERPMRNQWIGIALAVVGVVVLTYLS